MAELFWPAVLSMSAFYLATFAVGIWASRRGRRSDSEGSLADFMLAGRSLPPWIALCTMTATWVGGGYINGTAERSFSEGVFWGAQAGVGYALSLVVGGLVFARSMRRRGFSTLIDPFERRYGPRVAAILMLPAVLAELFWSGAILVALGSTFSVILGLELPGAILGSAAIGIAYTALGGLRAVAYTDLLQLALIFVGLGVAVPFVVGAAGGLAAQALLRHFAYSGSAYILSIFHLYSIYITSYILSYILFTPISIPALSPHFKTFVFYL